VWPVGSKNARFQVVTQTIVACVDWKPAVVCKRVEREKTRWEKYYIFVESRDHMTGRSVAIP
jgi:hypothetical protein